MRLTNGSGGVTSKVETDPLGTQVSDTSAFNQNGGGSGYGFNPQGFYGDPTMPDMGCRYDGVPTPCSMAAHAAEAERSVGRTPDVVFGNPWDVRNLQMTIGGNSYQFDHGPFITTITPGGAPPAPAGITLTRPFATPGRTISMGNVGADMGYRWIPSYFTDSSGEVSEIGGEYTNPQESFPGAYGRIKFLRADESYGESKQQTILDTLVSLAENGNCAKAFKDAGLATIKDLIQGGLVIGGGSLLQDPRDAASIGITEAARARDAGAYASTAIQAVTVRDHPGKTPDTTDGRPRIFLNASAFGGGALSLREVLTHELIHIAGADAKDPGILGTLLGRDDLSYYKYYDSILKACK